MIQIDIDMPKNCASCPCVNTQVDYCYAKGKCIKKLNNVYPYTEKRPDWCPLKEASDMIDRKSVLNLLRVMKDEFNSVPEAYKTLGNAIMRMNK